MKKIILEESEIPKQWYNILPDLPSPLDPPLDPETKQPISPEKLRALFPEELIQQEMSDKRWIDIPPEVLDVYAIWRPTPLIRAINLEEYLDTPAKIYYKYEGTAPPGSHKPNTAVPQAYYNAKEGIKKLTTETGAGQWGSSLAFAGQYFGVEVKVYMVKVSYLQKPYRRVLMETWGAKVIPSPSPYTKSGREILKEDPDNPGSLGIAISEAVEEALENSDTHYSLGSVLNHVLLHQTVIGLEAKKQLAKVKHYPDLIIGSVGGGSNFGGLALPFMIERLEGDSCTRFIAVEPASCPTLTKGRYDYDFGDTVGFTPLMKMHTLGHDFIPPSIHAGGLRYHGMAPIISKLYDEGLLEAVAVPQTEVFKAAVEFARTEGIVPAPESAHAVKVVIDEALKCRQTGEQKVILFNLSGHGLLDLMAYQKYFEGELSD
ncbi:TrpB-like pyridoxal phosphate-dependent enzyme [Persephonella sp.]|uniref:TrpB-like pyridoxal phosphate-dependent enzyme n=1 Tax=Persephonella sp. TaxID=2060922 RepID=UPI0025F9D96C|nr:TrpB-like pyridoxal phosphate-dependent enzyme [Persephonella sp.]